MINGISFKNTNFYYCRNRNFCTENREQKKNSYQTVNFKSKYTSQKKLLSNSFLSLISFSKIEQIFSNKSSIDLLKYFESSKSIPAYIWQNEELINNPDCQTYIKKLENLKDSEKKAFVKIFCKNTGFPNLKKVQKNIDQELRSSIGNLLDETGYKPLFIGYSSVSSAGRGLAIPGSDCDGLFVIVDKPIDFDLIHRAKIGDCINQRLVSTTGKDYPELFSIEDMLHYIDYANEIFEKIKTPQKIKEYKQNILRADNDFIKAGQFNIDLSSKIKNPYEKNLFYLTGMFVEEVRAGHIVVNNLSSGILEHIKNSALYKYSNINRQEGFKNILKPKLESRIELCKNFKNMTPEEQFKICFGIFKSSMGIKNNEIGDMQKTFDMGNILEFVHKVTNYN